MCAFFKGIWGFIQILMALWMFADIGLDVLQARKYYQLSPQLNSDHEANSNLTLRIQKFCGDLDQINFSDFAELTDPQKNLRDEWNERCRTTNFSFSMESAKVSTF